jgi:serine/threonine-protein kinase
MTTTSADGAVSGSTVMERQSRMVAIVGALLLVTLTIAAVVATRRVVRYQAEASLRTLLAATSSGVMGWYADQHRYAERLMHRDPLRDSTLAILQKSGADKGAILTEMDRYLAGQFIGILVVDRTLTLQASSQPDWKIEAVPSDVVACLRRCVTGEVVVTRPVLVGSGPSRRAIVLLGIPTLAHNGLETAGALLLAFDAMTELQPLWDDTWLAGHGETYMASPDGLIIAGSRPLTDLRQLGLVPSDASSRARDVQLVDPGRRLTVDAPWLPTDGAGPTRVARALAAGQTGGDAEGSADYRGVTVIAQWRWLPDIGVGLVCEVDRQYAYWPIRLLELICLAALLVTASGLVVGLVYFRRSSWAMRRAWEIQRRVDELDRYVIGDKIGEGAMGCIYRATHARLRRQAAIKVIRAQAMTPQNIIRFEHEAQMTCRLTNPNTVQIFDYGTLADGSLYYVMEFLEGMSLHELIARHGAQPAGRVIHLLSQALGALAEAHRIGLVHRDIKPSNVFLATLGGRCDVVKLLDFGLAHDNGSDANALTSTGAIMGSPSCMPPELIVRSGKPVDGRADLYSLACLGYRLITGQDVFTADTVMGILHAHLHDSPQSPSRCLGKEVPADLEALLLRCLSKLPEDRPADADACRAELLACADAGMWREADAEEWWKRVLGVKARRARNAQASAMADTRRGPATEAAPAAAAAGGDAHG